RRANDLSHQPGSTGRFAFHDQELRLPVLQRLCIPAEVVTTRIGRTSRTRKSLTTYEAVGTARHLYVRRARPDLGAALPATDPLQKNDPRRSGDTCSAERLSEKS